MLTSGERASRQSRKVFYPDASLLRWIVYLVEFTNELAKYPSIQQKKRRETFSRARRDTVSKVTGYLDT
jgi:hypothetical protein